MILSKTTGLSTFSSPRNQRRGDRRPRVLEHMVDTVLYFEGIGHPIEFSAVKNRFGSTNEIGVFEMKEGGLKKFPTRLNFSRRTPHRCPRLRGHLQSRRNPADPRRLQALVSPTSYGMPRRTAIGFDPNRSLSSSPSWKRRSGESGQQDIFVNVAGGVKVDEPAVDLGVVCAVASSYLDKPIHQKPWSSGKSALPAKYGNSPGGSAHQGGFQAGLPAMSFTSEQSDAPIPKV